MQFTAGSVLNTWEISTIKAGENVILKGGRFVECFLLGGGGRPRSISAVLLYPIPSYSGFLTEFGSKQGAGRLQWSSLFPAALGLQVLWPHQALRFKVYQLTILRDPLTRSVCPGVGLHQALYCWDLSWDLNTYTKSTKSILIHWAVSPVPEICLFLCL